MSLERACVNCFRCHELACNILTGSKNEGAYIDACLESDKLYGARNEALRALEDEQRDCLQVSILKGIALETTNSGLATQALRLCAGCDYSSPKIRKLVSIHTKTKDYRGPKKKRT